MSESNKPNGLNNAGEPDSSPLPPPAADEALVKKMVYYGDDILRARTRLITDIDDSIIQLVKSMFATMYDAPGIGLAAPQIGELLSLITVDPRRPEEGSRSLAMINPEIIEYSGRSTYEEGCLSIPGVFEDVRRPSMIKIRYRDTEGEQKTEEFDGIMARVIQHECDHLRGKLFVDHLSTMRRALVRKRLREIEQY